MCSSRSSQRAAGKDVINNHPQFWNLDSDLVGKKVRDLRDKITLICRYESAGLEGVDFTNFTENTSAEFGNQNCYAVQDYYKDRNADQKTEDVKKFLLAGMNPRGLRPQFRLNFVSGRNGIFGSNENRANAMNRKVFAYLNTIDKGS